MKVESGKWKFFKKISNLKSQISTPKGFTLVELLVVIGVLGILAAGLLATIDPLEQFRRGADSNKKTSALELLNATTRYYATKGSLPWAAVANGGDSACNANYGTPPSAALGSSAAFAPCITALINAGELKSTFISQTQILNALYVTDVTVGQATAAVVCYDPESKAESGRAETLYGQTGTVGAGCPATGTCYWCAR